MKCLYCSKPLNNVEYKYCSFECCFAFENKLVKKTAKIPKYLTVLALINEQWIPATIIQNNSNGTKKVVALKASNKNAKNSPVELGQVYIVTTWKSLEF